MRSIKGIIIGFLLILLGFAVTSYSLIAGGVLAAAGLAAVVIFALPKKTQQPQAEQPPAPAPEPEDPAPELRPEALPDILTDPPAQKKPEPPPAADAQTLFGTLAEAYTRIDELTCRGPAWMLERDIRLCRAFCERWEAAVKDPVFASFVRAKARYADYTDEFLLPGFGKRGRIHGRRTSGELLDDLTAAVKNAPPDRKAPCRALCAPSSGLSPSAGSCAACSLPCRRALPEKPCRGRSRSRPPCARIRRCRRWIPSASSRSRPPASTRAGMSWCSCPR